MLALIAGEGRLPVLLHEVLETSPFVVALEGHPPKRIPHHLTFRVERLGTLLQMLKEKGVTEVCFAGAIRRPKLDPSAIDAATMPLVPKMMAALQTGDDAALRTVLDIFEEAGFGVRAAHEIRPDLLPPEGVLSEAQPDERMTKDADRAKDIVAALGRVDVGQGCIVAGGQALAVETMAGTDWMLRVTGLARQAGAIRDEMRPFPSAQSLAEALSGHTGVPMAEAIGFPSDVPEGGVFYKAAKPDQDRRIDLPAIGRATIDAARWAGLSGVVIEAGSVMILDREETVAAADAHDMVLWVRP